MMLRLLWKLAPVWTAALLLAALFAAPGTSARLMHLGGGQVGLPPFTSVTFGTFASYGNGACPAAKCINGDTFFNTWADDGKIYTWSCDSSNWNAATASPGNQAANVMFSTLSGYTPAMTGTLVNLMGAWYSTGTPTDNANYKISGGLSVRGTMVASAIRQTSSNWLSSQLIKSIDHGQSWAPIPPGGVNNAQPYVSPTFTDFKFNIPMFFQYGKDYQSQTVDRSDTYVYALSSDWTSGVTQTQLILGRTLISALTAAGTASAADWQYYQGPGGGGYGELDANWGALSTAVPVLTDATGHIGYSGSPTYLPAFGTYWFVVEGQVSVSDRTWRIYQGSHPWGPWTFVPPQFEWNTSNPQSGGYGFYFPAIVPNSLVPDGGRTFTLLSSADYAAPAVYTMWIVPVTLH